MKIIVLLLILAILLVNPISAKTIEETLYEGDSIEVSGYNITLLVIGDNKKSIVACINNEIHIIDRGNKREIENLKVEPKRIYEDYIKLQITYSGENTCDESCSNSICLGIKPQEEENESIQEENEFIQEKETTKRDNTTLTSVGLFLLVLILLIILLIKKKR